MVFEIRCLLESEVVTASNMADAVYCAELYESLESFRSKHLSFPHGFVGCFTNEMIAYSVGFPWRDSNGLVTINSETTPVLDADCYYLHDMCVIPEYRRHGIARQLLDYHVDLARDLGLNRIIAVAVNNTPHIWSRLGFNLIYSCQYAGVQAVRMEMSLD